MLETKRMEMEKPATKTFMRTPFTFMRRFAEDMDRMFEDFRFPTMFTKEFPFRMEMKGDWVPAIEVLENNGKFMVRCDLPGMKKEDIKIELNDELLTISGERNEEKKEESEGFYRTERTYGSFYRTVPLPTTVTPETAEATFRNGVLEITMPSTKKEPTPRKIEIKEPATEKAAGKAA